MCPSLVNKMQGTVIIQTDRQCTYNVTLRRVSHYHCCGRKEISITHSKCVSVGLVIRHAKRMRRTVIRVLSRSTVLFPHYVINGTIFEKNSYWKWNFCFDFLVQSSFEIFLILRRTERDMIINVFWSSCKVSVYGLHVKYRFLVFM